MKLHTLLIIFFISISSLLKANDSTDLYKKRILKIKQLHAWLAKRPYEKVNVYNDDTTSRSWKSYDTVINYFFNKHDLDSLFNEKTEVFSVEAKFQLLKQMINDFHDLAKRMCFENLSFKTVNQNFIIQFFTIDKQEYIVTAFVFKDQSPELMSMILYGMPEEKYKIFKRFYDRLEPCSN